MTPIAFLDIGFGEMVVVAFVALLVYGGRLPDMMRKFGATIREFKRGLEAVSKNPLATRAPPPPTAPYRAPVPPEPSAGGASDRPLPGASVPVGPPAPATAEPQPSVEPIPPIESASTNSLSDDAPLV